MHAPQVALDTETVTVTAMAQVPMNKARPRVIFLIIARGSDRLTGAAPFGCVKMVKRYGIDQHWKVVR